MPSLPRKTTRRRGVIPTTTLHREDIWRRTLDLLGLEPLHPAAAAASPAAPGATSASSNASSSSSAKKSMDMSNTTTTMLTAGAGGDAMSTSTGSLGAEVVGAVGAGSSSLPTSRAPIASRDNPHNDMETSSEHTSVSRPASSAPKRARSILDLPQEVQKEIFRHASITELVALSLVSKHFRDIAAERLYRSFHIVFPDDDHPSSDYQIDDLASGLDTFVTSDYDYSQYLREIILETVSGGEKAERTYRHYLYDASCGKFMNTLLLLTLRKAKSLETFRWDIRVELSRDVFKTLHNIVSLQHLHLRMQAGTSGYRAPPSFPPSSVLTTSGSTILSFPAQHVNPPIFAAPQITFPPLPPLSPPPPPPPPTSSKNPPKATKRTQKCLLPPVRTDPPTLSGFKNLKTLAVLDMDTMEYISELRTCISNCAASLTSLELSFSDYFASKSRKPPVDPNSDDETDQEDDFGQPLPGGLPPMQSASVLDGSAPSKAIKAQEEKKAQESALSKIFDLESPVEPVDSPIEKTAPATASTGEPDKQKYFAEGVKSVVTKLLKMSQPNGDMTPEAQAALETIIKATEAYCDKKNVRKAKDNPPNPEAPCTPVGASAQSSEDVAEEGPGLFDDSEQSKKKVVLESGVSDPDDIDIEQPEGTELTIDAQPTPLLLPHQDEDGPSNADEPLVLPGSLGARPESAEVAMFNFTGVATQEMADWEPGNDTHRLLQRCLDLEAKAVQIDSRCGEMRPNCQQVWQQWRKYFGEVIAKVQNQGDMQLLDRIHQLNDFATHSLETRAAEASPAKPAPSLVVDTTTTKAADKSETNPPLQMSDYIRKTRGLRLEHLAIYLIPMKASLLSRAVDLNVLESITLLNCGPQAAFWNLIMKKDQASPLPLCKIHTDNVNQVFLQCASQLSTIKELCLLERSQKKRGEATAARTTVTMEQIRTKILKKHAAHLVILVIRNEAGNEWDLNVKATLLLCRRAKKLEELAVSFGIKTMHALLQNMPGLTSLRALHTISFRTEDTCLWVMREFRKFTLDNISHNPEMKLAWLALDNSVEALVRRVKPPPSKDAKSKTGKDKNGKGKAKASDGEAQSVVDVIMPVFLEGMGSSGISTPTASSDGAAASASTFGLDAAAAAGDKTDWMDSSEDDDDYYRGKAGLKIDSIEGIQFQDVPGVRIFERSILGGRL